MFPSRSRFAGSLAAALVLCAACGDLDTTEPVEVSTPETLPALEFRTPTPSVPELLRSWGTDLAMDDAVEQWNASWLLPRDEGRAARAELHRALAPILAEGATATEVEGPVQELDRAVQALERLLGGDLPDRLVPSLDGARTARNEAVEGLAGDDLAAAIRHLLDGADLLRSMSAAGVASELVTEAEERLRRIPGDGAYSEESRERAQRLVTGARAALEEGQSVTALRRAWYAVQLLNEPGDS